MGLQFKIENEIINSESCFVLKIISNSVNEVKGVIDIIKSNSKKNVNKEFSDGENGMVLEMDGNFYSPEGKSIMPDSVVGSKIAAFANNEVGVQFSEEVGLDKILIGRKMAGYVNNNK
jgi:hypothetical protein